MKLRIIPGFDESKNTLAASLCELKNSGLLLVYAVDGKPFYQITQWESHQNFNAKNRGLKSKYPDPVSAVTVNHGESLEEVEVEVESKINKEKTPFAPTDKIHRPVQVVYNFETRNWENITDADLKQWADAYPAVDIERNIREAGAWLVANPHKRKKQYRRFLLNWFAKRQEKGGDKKPDAPKPTGMRRDTPEYEAWCLAQCEKREREKQLAANAK